MIRIKWGWFVAVIASAIGAGAAGTIAVIVWFTYNIGG